MERDEHRLLLGSRGRRASPGRSDLSHSGGRPRVPEKPTLGALVRKCGVATRTRGRPARKARRGPRARCGKQARSNAASRDASAFECNPYFRIRVLRPTVPVSGNDCRHRRTRVSDVNRRDPCAPRAQPSAISDSGAGQRSAGPAEAFQPPGPEELLGLRVPPHGGHHGMAVSCAAASVVARGPGADNDASHRTAAQGQQPRPRAAGPPPRPTSASAARGRWHAEAGPPPPPDPPPAPRAVRGRPWPSSWRPV